MSQILTKDLNANLVLAYDIATELELGETITAAVIDTVSPVSIPALTVSIPSFAGTVLQLSLQSGSESTTYGIRIQVSTSAGRDVFVVPAVFVASPDFAPFVGNNQYAFQSLVDELAAGEAALGNAFFVFPPGKDVSQGQVTWALIDNENRIYASGNAHDYRVGQTSFGTTVEATSVVHSPSNIPPSLDRQSYQIRWEYNSPNEPTVFMFESLKILGISTVPEGATSTVELAGDVASLSLLTSKNYDTVAIEVFDGNNRILGPNSVNNPKKTASGWYYETSIPTSGRMPKLDAYAVTWKMSNSSMPGQVFRQSASIYIMTATMLGAIDSVRSMVQKSNTSLLGFQDILFETSTIANWLVRGRDMFNAAGGFMTSFDMTYATGGVREFWLRYAEIVMLRAQALAEGEKAFDFQGQAISLNVDKATHYTQLADALQATVDQEVKPFKVSLKTAGITGGDGNVTNAVSRNLPRLGISLHPASQFGRYGIRI